MIKMIASMGLLFAVLPVLPPNAFPDDNVKSPAIIGGKIWNESDTLEPATKSEKDTLRSSPPEAKNSMFSGDMIEMPARTVSKDANVLRLKLSIPKNLKFIKEAPILLMAKSSDPDVIEIGRGEGNDPKKGFTFPLTAHSGTADLIVVYRVVCCTTGEDSACFFKEAKLKVPVTVGESDNDIIEIRHRIDD